MGPMNILTGFQSSGIYPFNKDLLSDVDSAQAASTDRELVVSQESQEDVNSSEFHAKEVDDQAPALST